MGEVESGAAAGVGDIVTDAMQIDLVHIPRGLFQIVGTAWRDGDPVGGLAALFWTPGRQLVDEVVAQAIDGDFKAAGAAGVKAITVGVAAGVALGELGAAGVEAARSARTGGADATVERRRFSPEQREKGLEKAKDADGLPRCEHCGKEVTTKYGQPNSYEADHRLPHSRGGPSTDENLAPSCRTCNRSKGARTPEEWK